METFLALLPAIIGVIGAIGAAAVQSGVNASATKETNEANLQYAEQKTMQQWEREDDSLQRQVRDAKLAGLSPLNVTGAMGTGAPVNYTAQAPQMDLSSLIGAFSSFGNMTNTISSKQIEEYRQEKEDERLDKQLTFNLNALEKQIQADKDLQNSQFVQDSLVLGKQLTYEYTVLNEQSIQKKQELENERLLNINKQNQELYLQVCQSIGMSPQVEYVSIKDLSEYQTKLSAFMQSYNKWAKDSSHFSDDYNLVSQSQTDNSGVGSNVAGIAGVNFSEGSSESAQYDYSDSRMRKLYKEYLSNAVFPVLIDDQEWSFREYSLEE